MSTAATAPSSKRKTVSGTILPASSSSSASDQEVILETVPKKPKLASIFQPRLPKQSDDNQSVSGKFTWLEPIGTNKTCLHGVYGDFKGSEKVALFDLDGTIIRPKGHKVFPSAKDEYDFQFCFPGVIDKIKKQHTDGFAIVIVTNQKQTQSTTKGTLTTWKNKMAHVANAIDVPLRVFAATAADSYRKPCLGSWHEFVENWNDGLAIDLEQSYYVGDAAGRKTPIKDHGDSDLKWAINAGIQFFVPEQYFLGKTIKVPSPTKPWLNENVKEISECFLPETLSSSSPEIILFVGPPASGKTSFFNRYLNPQGYEWINQDTLKTRNKCLQAVTDCIENKKSCVVDNTNRDKATRKHYLNLANQLQVPIRCFFFNLSKQQCFHNNYFRASSVNPSDQKRDLVPTLAFESFFKSLEIPDKNEGFSQVPTTIYWKFEGDDQLRRKYEMHYH